jgi:hypothetical protein
LAVVLTAGALAIVGHALWRWGVDRALPLSVLWAPLGAFGARVSVESRDDWSSGSRRVLTIVGFALSLFFGVLFVYGAYEWVQRDAAPVLPLFAFGYLILTFLGARRRSRRPPEI